MVRRKVAAQQISRGRTHRNREIEDAENAAALFFRK